MPYETSSGGAPAMTARARSATSASTQPPETEPKMRPVAVTASFAPGRRAQLGAGVDELALRARTLPRVREAVLFLAGEVELAWRLFALALVAEELAE